MVEEERLESVEYGKNDTEEELLEEWLWERRERRSWRQKGQNPIDRRCFCGASTEGVGDCERRLGVGECE